MTFEEVNNMIDSITWSYGGEYITTEDIVKCRETCHKALEKQIPKKPIDKTKRDNTTAKHYENCKIVVCPLCNGRLKLKSKGKHCDKCGQALDCSDTE